MTVRNTELEEQDARSVAWMVEGLLTPRVGEVYANLYWNGIVVTEVHAHSVLDAVHYADRISLRKTPIHIWKKWVATGHLRYIRTDHA